MLSIQLGSVSVDQGSVVSIMIVSMMLIMLSVIIRFLLWWKCVLSLIFSVLCMLSQIVISNVSEIVFVIGLKSMMLLISSDMRLKLIVQLCFLWFLFVNFEMIDIILVIVKNVLIMMVVVQVVEKGDVKVVNFNMIDSMLQVRIQFQLVFVCGVLVVVVLVKCVCVLVMIEFFMLFCCNGLLC